uniref:PHD-type domain-containing protein n=1 Tax=Amphimedon queenslandica TaxID=400682 RepID=A0A1X7SWP5_AMPQE
MHLVEIKCPYTVRHTSPTRSQGVVMLSQKHSYYTQIQCQLLVADRETCDFVCWTPHGIFMEIIARDESYCEKIVNKSRSFFCKYLLPELLTHKFKEGVIVSESATNEKNEDNKYCFCKEHKDGKMIACDGPKCDIEWFHYKCVGVSRKPKGNWYCPNCRT